MPSPMQSLSGVPRFLSALADIADLAKVALAREVLGADAASLYAATQVKVLVHFADPAAAAALAERLRQAMARAGEAQLAYRDGVLDLYELVARAPVPTAARYDDPDLPFDCLAVEEAWHRVTAIQGEWTLAMAAAVSVAQELRAAIREQAVCPPHPCALDPDGQGRVGMAGLATQARARRASLARQAIGLWAAQRVRRDASPTVPAEQPATTDRPAGTGTDTAPDDRRNRRGKGSAATSA